MEFLKKMIHILSWLIYILIIIYVLICAPMIFGYKPLVVLSGSMEPTYGVGSVIYYHETPKEEIKVGDAITFTYETDFITHRVVNTLYRILCKFYKQTSIFNRCSHINFGIRVFTQSF